MHGISDITGIAIVAVAAMVCGMAMVRLRQPAIIGYIFAGLILGPNGLSLVENRETIDLLAQLGVIMLLFFIGMELSLRSFRTIWKVAIISALAQIGLSVGALYILGGLFDWPVEWAILFGFCLALSSTAVAVKVLEETGELRNNTGRLTVGILIAQDLAVAPMLVVISNMSAQNEGGMIHMIVEVSLSIGILLAIILFLTRRSKVNLPFHKIVSPNSDLKPLAALTFCFGFATIAGIIGLSPAFGAFLAGLIVGNSAQRQEVHENAGPIQAILIMVFFLSIGLLIDLPFVWENIWLILGLLLFVIIFKTALNVLILRLQGQSWQTAFSVSLVIGQLGEFSFVMAALLGMRFSVVTSLPVSIPVIGDGDTGYGNAMNVRRTVSGFARAGWLVRHEVARLCTGLLSLVFGGCFLWVHSMRVVDDSSDLSIGWSAGVVLLGVMVCLAFMGRAFLVGTEHPTEADLRLFPTLFRHDAIYYARFRLN